MIRKFIILAGLIAFLFAATPALAGGWVLITLDSLPEGIHAGEPVEISFMVRQHGQTPTHNVSPILVATNTITGERIRVEAEKARETGRFIVTVDFPSTGVWEWSISAEPYAQYTTLAPINVLAPKQAIVQEQSIEPDNITPTYNFPLQAVLRWGGLSLLAAGLALIIFDQRRRQAITSPVSGD